MAVVSSRKELAESIDVGGVEVANPDGNAVDAPWPHEVDADVGSTDNAVARQWDHEGEPVDAVDDSNPGWGDKALTGDGDSLGVHDRCLRCRGCFAPSRGSRCATDAATGARATPPLEIQHMSIARRTRQTRYALNQERMRRSSERILPLATTLRATQWKHIGSQTGILRTTLTIET